MAARGRGRPAPRSRGGGGEGSRAGARPPHTHQPPPEAARGRKGHSGRPGPDPRPGGHARRSGGAHGVGREERPLVGTRHHRRAGGGRHGWEATTGLRSTSAPGRGTGSAGRRGEAARQRLGDKGLGRQKPEQPRGKRTAGRREGAQEPLKRRLPRPEVGHRGTRGPTAPRPPAQGRSHGTRGQRPGPRPALATSRGSGPRPPRHSHDRPPTGHSHTHDDIPPCPARLDPRGLSSSPGAEAPSPRDDPLPKSP